MIPKFRIKPPDLIATSNQFLVILHKSVNSFSKYNLIVLSTSTKHFVKNQNHKKIQKIGHISFIVKGSFPIFSQLPRISKNAISFKIFDLFGGK